MSTAGLYKCAADFTASGTFLGGTVTSQVATISILGELGMFPIPSRDLQVKLTKPFQNLPRSPRRWRSWKDRTPPWPVPSPATPTLSLWSGTRMVRRFPQILPIIRTLNIQQHIQLVYHSSHLVDNFLVNIWSNWLIQATEGGVYLCKATYVAEGQFSGGELSSDTVTVTEIGILLVYLSIVC